MERCDEPIVQEFLKLDEPGITASIEVNAARLTTPADVDKD